MSGLVETLSTAPYKTLPTAKRSVFWESLFADSEDHLWFINAETLSSRHSELVILLKTPENAVGHSGISHGGVIATLLDESLCYAAYPVLPHHTGVTASLNIDYRQPTLSGSWIIIQGLANSNEGSRKAEVRAKVYQADLSDSKLPWEDESAKPLSEALQIVVEPKWHEKLNHRNISIPAHNITALYGT